MKRRIVMVLLALGATAGFAAGFVHLGFHIHARHQAMERHLAQVCADAARSAPAAR